MFPRPGSGASFFVQGPSEPESINDSNGHASSPLLPIDIGQIDF